VSIPPPAPASARPANWYADPLNPQLLRYHDGARWTFWTTTPRSTAQESPEPTPSGPASDAAVPMQGPAALRPDIAAAMAQASNMLGSAKEARLLPTKLLPGEEVHGVAGGLLDGFGVLACTNLRLLFFFKGVMRETFRWAQWDDIGAIELGPDGKTVHVFVGKRLKRSQPAFSVIMRDRNEVARFETLVTALWNAPRVQSR
jgi:hypothetical protein